MGTPGVPPARARRRLGQANLDIIFMTRVENYMQSMDFHDAYTLVHFFFLGVGVVLLTVIILILIITVSTT